MSSGALSGAFIPVFTERLQTGRQKEAWEVFSIIACFMGLVLGSVILLAEIFTDPLVRWLAAPGFAKDSPELIPLVVSLTRIILPSQLFFFLGGLMMGTLESRQNFRARAAGPVIYNLGIIFGVVVLSRWLDIRGLAWGALGGAFVGNIGYTFYTLKKAGFEAPPKRWTEYREFARKVKEATGVPVVVAENPIEAVALGTGKALEMLHVLENAVLSSDDVLRR
jgi:putative peptidoglycan lipid II flippase